MRIVFFGTPAFAVPTLECLLQSPEFEVVAVVTQPDKRRGRGGHASASPVKQVAIAHHLPVWNPPRIKKAPEVLAELSALQADVFVVVAYGQLFSPAMLAMPRLGCVNIHGSLLPKYRGAAPIQWCLYHGEPETGITTMFMEAGMDTGPMLLKAITPIAPLENAVELAERLAGIGADLLIDTLTQLRAKALTPIPQDDAQATYAPLIQKADYCIDWQRSAIALHNQIRGFYPHCVAQYQGERLKILATVPLAPPYYTTLPELEATAIAAALPTLTEAAGTPPETPPGTIVYLLKGLGPIVQTGDGYLLLRHVQPSGKRQQSGWDFVNGSHLYPGDRLEPGLT
ncbi:methionyl-tRNA formyltransferase [Trichothermofontia sp.]